LKKGKSRTATSDTTSLTIQGHKDFSTYEIGVRLSDALVKASAAEARIRELTAQLKEEKVQLKDDRAFIQGLQTILHDRSRQ
jgi:hypothetical protein